MFSLFVLRLFSLSFPFPLFHPLFASPEQATLYSEVGFDESSLFDQGKQKPGPKPIRLAFIHDLKKSKWSSNSKIIAKKSTLWIEWFFSVSFYPMRIVSRVSKCIRATMTWYKIWKTRSLFKFSCKRASARKYRTHDRNYRTCATVFHKMFYIAHLPEYNGPPMKRLSAHCEKNSHDNLQEMLNVFVARGWNVGGSVARERNWISSVYGSSPMTKIVRIKQRVAIETVLATWIPRYASFHGIINREIKGGRGIRVFYVSKPSSSNAGKYAIAWITTGTCQ